MPCARPDPTRPNSARAHLSVPVFVAALLVGSGAARAEERAFAYSPLGDEDSIAILAADDAGNQLTPVGTAFHVEGTRHPRSVILHPTLDELYVVHEASGRELASVSRHTIDRRTGALEYQGAAFGAEGRDLTGLSLVFDREGDHAYVLGEEGRTLRTFELDPRSGDWRERHTAMPTGAGPCQILLDPRERFLFVLNRDDSTISRFRLDERGRPEVAGTNLELNNSCPIEGAFDATGDRLFLTLDTWNIVVSMGLDPRDGTLHTINAVATGEGPRGLVFSPERGRLYVAEEAAESISAFDVNGDSGRLGARLGPFRAHQRPTHLALSADEDTLWLAGHSTELEAFSLDGPAAAVRRETRPLAGSPGNVVGVEGRLASRLIEVEIEVDAEGRLTARGPAGASISRAPSSHGNPRRSGSGPVDETDELLVDPLGTWVATVQHRPGRLHLVRVDTEGGLSAPGPEYALAPTIATTAVDGSGTLIAVATRTPPAVHLLRVDRRAGTFIPLHALPLHTAPDALAFDPTGLLLCMSQRGAERVSVVRLDNIGFVGNLESVDLAGGPGPLAISPDGRIVYVGLIESEAVMPCRLDARRASLEPRPPLAVGTSALPADLELSRDGSRLAVATVDTTGQFGLVNIDVHPVTGALRVHDTAPLDVRTATALSVSFGSDPGRTETTQAALPLQATLQLVVPPARRQRETETAAAPLRPGDLAGIAVRGN